MMARDGYAILILLPRYAATLPHDYTPPLLRHAFSLLMFRRYCHDVMLPRCSYADYDSHVTLIHMPLRHTTLSQAFATF